MTNKYLREHFRGTFVFFIVCLLFAYCLPANAHDNPASHAMLKAWGDSSRALMSKEGYGRSFFTLYTNLEVTVTNESGKSVTQQLVEKLGTSFIVGGNFLLTNKHVADVDNIKKEYTEKINKVYSTLVPPQNVTLQFTESYKAVDSSNITFVVSLVKISDSIDAALFRFDKKLNPPRKSFALQDESESLFSPVAVPGSPLGISDVIGFGHIARAKLYECGDEKQEYLLFISSINPGNSGGPLYNLETDKVNGMVTMFLTPNVGNNSISCAVPASLLMKFLDENLPSRKK